ncbi:MAG TPA: conjugal transfer protein TraF [Cellvibrionaceae bacterium]
MTKQTRALISLNLLGLNLRRLGIGFTIAIVTLTSCLSEAAGFGIYDARAMGMGSAAAAVGDTHTGFFFNPALLAMGDENENRVRTSRLYFPMLSVQTTQASLDALDISEADLDIRLTEAIDQFNRSTGRETAINALDITNEADSAIDKLTDQNLEVDAYAGFVISIPSEYQGGAVALGTHIIGGGLTSVAPKDRALLNKYRDFLTYASQNDTLEGAPHPELIDETTGQIGNPANSISSYVAFRGAVLTELSVSAAGLWSFGKADIAVGATPKIVKALIFDEERRVVNDAVATDSNNSDHYYFDTDVGIVLQWKEQYRLGVTIKDLRSKQFISERGNLVTIKAKPRIGGAYVGEQFSLGLDLDLTPSNAFAGELTRQDFALGGEYRWRKIALRGGYRYDISGENSGAFSLGAGVMLGRWVSDIAFTQGSENLAAALQIGRAF